MLKLAKPVLRRLIPRALCITNLRPNAERNVLLTFDDGPHPDVTPAVLDLLNKHNAKAIFFVVGRRIKDAPHLLSQVLAEGHWLGNHSFGHPNDRKMGFREYLGDIQKCQQMIVEQTGAVPEFHRPPQGQITLASLLAPKKSGLRTMNWSCSTEDWRLRSKPEAIARADALANQIVARDIVLFHDRRSESIATLERLLPQLQQRGLTFRPQLSHIL